MPVFLAAADGTPAVYRLLSFAGLAVLVGIAWLLSTDRKSIQWRPVVIGIALQLAFGLVVLNEALSGFFFTVVDGAVNQLLAFSYEGANFVFGSMEPHLVLGVDGNPIVGESGDPVVWAGRVSPPAKTFAFWILPTIVFFSSLMSILYHFGIMQRVVSGLAWVMQRTMRTSGAESLSAAANIFVGQTEAPLLIKPYVEKMTRSELMAVMTGGFATVAGGVMAAYVGFLQDIPGIAGHLVAASIMSAPAALAVAKIMVPETGTPVTAGGAAELGDDAASTDRNAIEAAARGATEGMQLAFNVAAMLIAFVALIAMVDWCVGLVPLGGEPLSLSRILGVLFAPIAFIMGVPWSEATLVGRLLGEKIVLTEFIAYINLGTMVSEGQLSTRSAIIASYGLCGFANFASIGIQLGGIGGIAPKRMGDLAELGFRAMVAGSIAAFMTGTVAGMLLG